MRRTHQRVIHYFLPRGRMAALHMPDDMDDAETRRLLAHLRVDLLPDDDDDAEGAPATAGKADGDGS